MKKTLGITKALADRNRIRIILMLTRHEELCVCQIADVLKITMPSVSRHMSKLTVARLVESRKDSRWIYFSLAEEFPFELLDWLEESLSDSKEILNDRRVLEKVLSEKSMDFCKNNSNSRSKCNE
jgi:ArsR family transcriptional regulator, arsenate/arsenite/antimonite-responsive transcriptional repressor